MPLTDRQHRILNAIRISVTTRGYPPTVAELCAVSGLASTSSVAHQLRVLEFKGAIVREPNRPRAIRIIDQEAAHG